MRFVLAWVLASVLFAVAAPRAWAQAEPEVARLAAEAEAFAARDRWADALTSYEAAARITTSPTTRRDLQLALGVCRLSLGRYVDATESFEAYVAAGGEPSAVEDLLTQARGAVANVEILVDPHSAEIVVDGNLRPGTGATRVTPMDPGAHRIEVRAEGFATGTHDLTVRSGDVARVEMRLWRSPTSEPAAPSQPDLWSDPVLWVVVGGVALAGVGIGVGVYVGTQPNLEQGTTGIVLTALRVGP